MSERWRKGIIFVIYIYFRFIEVKLESIVEELLLFINGE